MRWFRRQGNDPGLLPSDVLEVFTWFEADGAAGRDSHLFAGSGVTTDTPLAGLHLEDAESAELDPLPRCIDNRIESNTASTATSALTLLMSASFETSLTMSTLIMLRDQSWRVSSIKCETLRCQGHS